MNKIFLLATASLVAVTFAGQASAQTAEQRIARLEAELRKLRAEVSQQATETKQVKTAVAKSPAYTPPIRAPYNWTGFTVGVVAGGSSADRTTRYDYQSASGSVLGRSSNGGMISPDYANYGANGMISNSTDGTAYNTWYDNPTDYDTVTYGSIPFQGNYSEAKSLDLISNRNLNGGVGPQLGYQLQRGSFVFGFAADIVGKSKSKENTFASNGSFTNSFGSLVTSTADGYVQNTCDVNGFGSGGLGCSVGSTWVSPTHTGSVTSTTSGSASFAGSSSVNQNWLSTVRATAGFAQDRTLVYATGGLAYGSISMKYNARYSDSIMGNCGGNGGGSEFSGSENGYVTSSAEVSCNGGSYGYTASSEGTSSTTATWSRSNNTMRAGFAVGGGFAYAMSDNLLVKFEGLYYNLGTASMLVNGSGATTRTGAAGSGTTATNVAPIKVSERLDGVIARIGISYKFD